MSAVYSTMLLPETNYISVYITCISFTDRYWESRGIEKSFKTLHPMGLKGYLGSIRRKCIHSGCFSLGKSCHPLILNQSTNFLKTRGYFEDECLPYREPSGQYKVFSLILIRGEEITLLDNTS